MMSPPHGSPGDSASEKRSRGEKPASVEGTVITEEPKGNITVREGHAELKMESFLSETRLKRLKEMRIKPVEKLTFEDIRNYNRDQLRAYCYVYGVPRKKKIEMEHDMARYASYFHKGDPAYNASTYTPRDPNEKKTAPDIPTESERMEKPGLTVPLTRQSSRLSVDSQPPSASPSRPPMDPGRDVGTGAQRPMPPPSSKAPPPIPTQQQVINEQKRRLSENQRRTWERENEHLRQSAAKFKAAFTGASPITANMVENAAAYFEGKETAEAIEDKALSWERYHRNSNLLKEIFDGVEPQEKRVKLTVDMKDLGGLIGLDKDKFTIDDVEKAAATHLKELEDRYKRIDEAEDSRDRIYIRAFQKLEKAATLEAIKDARVEFETEHNLQVVRVQPRVTPRTIDESLENEEFHDLHLLSF